MQKYPDTFSPTATGLLRGRPVVLGVFLFVLSLAVYGNNFDGVFLYDDFGHIVGNPCIQDLKNIPELLTNPRCFTANASGTYRPLIMVSWALNYALTGYAVWSYHVVNNLLHATNVLLFYFALRAIVAWFFEARKIPVSANYLNTVALPGAVLFAVHPLQGEAVNYINARSNLLCATFYLAGILSFINWRRLPQDLHATYKSRILAFLPAMSCVLSFGAKEIGGTLPATLFVLDCLLTPSRRDMLRTRNLLVHSSVLVAAVSFWHLYKYLIGIHGQGSGNIFSPSSDYSSYTISQAGVLLGYLRSFFWPSDLSFPRGAELLTEIGDSRVVIPLLLLALIPAVLFFLRRWSPLPLAGWLWAAIVMAPTSTVIPLSILAAERRCYLGLAGIALSLTGFLLLKPMRDRLATPLRLVIISVFLAACLAPVTVLRNNLWAQETAIYEDATRKHPSFVEAWIRYAIALSKTPDRDRAEQAARRAVSIDPANPKTHYALGIVLRRSGRCQEAADSLLKAIFPLVRSFNEYELAQLELAETYECLGRHREAMSIYERFLAVYPNDLRVLRGLGRASIELGDVPEGKSYLQRALAVQSNDLGTLRSLALASHKRGEYVEAELYYRRILESDPGNAGVMYNIGLILEKQGKLDGAETAWRNAAQAEPAHFQALIHLAELLESQPQRRDESLPFYEQARTNCPDPRCAEVLATKIAVLKKGTAVR